MPATYMAGPMEVFGLYPTEKAFPRLVFTHTHTHTHTHTDTHTQVRANTHTRRQTDIHGGAGVKSMCAESVCV